MGAKIAKLDSNDKIVEIVPQNNDQSISQDKLNKIKDMYNEHGIIKVRVDVEKLDKFVNDYVEKLLKGNKKIEENLKNTLKSSLGLGSVMLSMNGFILISEVDSNKTVEHLTIEPGMKRQECINITRNEYWKTLDIDMLDRNSRECAKIERFDENDGSGIDGYSSTCNHASVEGKGKEKEGFENGANDAKLAVMPHTNSVQNSAEQHLNTSTSVSTSVTNQEQQSGMKTMDILIPKVYLTPDRTKFIDLLLSTLGSNEKEDSNKKLFIKHLDTILEGLSRGTNPEIKIANVIGLIIRVAIISIVVENFKTLGENVISKDEEMQYAVTVVSELLVDFPSDSCTFYNEKLNFVSFTPNMCNVKHAEKKCPECKREDCPVAKCPEQKADSSTTWKIVSAILIVLVVCLITYMLVSNRHTIKTTVKTASESALSNLAKLRKP